MLSIVGGSGFTKTVFETELVFVIIILSTKRIFTKDLSIEVAFVQIRYI